MKASNLRKNSREELGKMLLDLSRELFNLKMQKGTGQLAKPDRVKNVKRDLARIHMILNEKTSA